MITARRDTRTAIVAWLIGGFVLSILALFGIMERPFLVTLLVAMTPLLLIFLVAEAFLRRHYARTASWRAGEKPLPEKAAAWSVSARVIHVEGTCPRGYHFKVGDTVSISDSTRGTGHVCPTVERLLKATSTRLGEGGPSGEEVRCLGEDHRVIFALRDQGKPAAPPPQRDRDGIGRLK